MIYITAEIRKINYRPLLCSELPIFNISQLSEALSEKAAFYLNIDDQNKFAVSRWVSPKRTRSYPYSRVYDTLQFSGKRVTIIPVFKDEGRNGDRDFLQWDTVSLMSLMGVYVFIGYYDQAEKTFVNPQKPKITNQRFALLPIFENIQRLLSYQSDALHWNLEQLERVGQIGDYAITAYRMIEEKCGVPLHSFTAAERKVEILRQDAEVFKKKSRQLASSAASRETQVLNPNENLSGKKGRITILNYLGGEYHITVDEIWIKDDGVQLVEAKHTSSPGKLIPSENDIKDALVRMILFTNLENVIIGGRNYHHSSVMKLTSSGGFLYRDLPKEKKLMYDILCEEASINGFSIVHQ